MKATKFIFCAVMMLLIASCKPDCVVTPDIVFGDSYAGIDGVWKLKTFSQTDLLYKAVTKPSLDLTSFWTKNGNAYTCTFNTANKTYTTAGDVRVNYLGASGTFTFDDDKNPASVIMTSNTGQVMTLKLNKPIRAEYGNNLDVSQPRTNQGKATIYYNYVFTK